MENPIKILNWIAFVAILSITIQNEYYLKTGKKVNDSREKKYFRYGMWAGSVGFFILALMGF